MAEGIVRELTEHDIEAVLEIDRKITGRDTADYWRDKALAFLSRPLSVCLGVDVGGRLVGFVLGEVRGWEFGTPLSGWLEVVGVDPDYHHKGLGRRLVEALCQRFASAGVESLQTIVDWNDGDLVSYFISLGFKRGEFIHLKKELGATGGLRS